MALITFGVDASHGYERIHFHALRSLVELTTCFALSQVAIRRDAKEHAGLKGFPRQPMSKAEQYLTPEVDEPKDVEWNTSTRRTSSGSEACSRSVETALGLLRMTLSW